MKCQTKFQHVYALVTAHIRTWMNLIEHCLVLLNHNGESAKPKPAIAISHAIFTRAYTVSTASNMTRLASGEWRVLLATRFWRLIRRSSLANRHCLLDTRYWLANSRRVLVCDSHTRCEYSLETRTLDTRYSQVTSCYSRSVLYNVIKWINNYA